jgi:hypothetical protein
VVSGIGTNTLLAIRLAMSVMSSIDPMTILPQCDRDFVSQRWPTFPGIRRGVKRLTQ